MLLRLKQTRSPCLALTLIEWSQQFFVGVMEHVTIYPKQRLLLQSSLEQNSQGKSGEQKMPTRWLTFSGGYGNFRDTYQSSGRENSGFTPDIGYISSAVAPDHYISVPCLKAHQKKLPAPFLFSKTADMPTPPRGISLKRWETHPRSRLSPS